MGAVAFPEMKAKQYKDRLSTGTIAAGGTLGVLIPPSTMFIIIGIITQTSIGGLFLAGVLPGILLSGMYMLTIFFMCVKNPALGPRSEAFSWKERLISLKGLLGVLVLVFVVLGGLYLGVFTPSEAGCIGAFGALVISLIKNTPMSTLTRALRNAARTTSYMLLILVGAAIFNNFLATSGGSAALTEWIIALPLPPTGIIIIMLLMYIPLGMFIDTLGMIFLTVPIFFPVILQLGFDPIWFGLMVCLVAELGATTPPVAINIFVVQGVTKVPMEEIFRGVIPFITVMVIAMALLVAFPEIALFLPSTMK